MNPLLRTGIVIAVLMFTATALAYALKPTTRLADLQPREKLETLIPLQFGDWQGMPTANIVIADPQMRENLDRIYTDILNRVYVDSRGRQVMLSIAYGEDQRDSMSMHYPEVCYPAQGFQTRSISKGQIVTPFGSIRVKRLEMVLNQRLEPITYWTMIGERQSLGGIDKKLNELHYSFGGTIPDGLLIRVSSVGREPESAYRDHEEFAEALLSVLTPNARKRMAGI
ncbi:MAG: exosortase-associated protein EpsI, B-type [Pseudomonadota bacterium]